MKTKGMKKKQKYIFKPESKRKKQAKERGRKQM